MVIAFAFEANTKKVTKLPNLYDFVWKRKLISSFYSLWCFSLRCQANSRKMVIQSVKVNLKQSERVKIVWQTIM